jgi:hypothetical protein
MLSILASYSWGEIANAILQIIGGASVIAKLTPTPKDDNFLAKVKRWVGFIALNPTIKPPPKAND